MSPELEAPGTTHTYVAQVWWKDPATWFNIASALVLILSESSVVQIIPEQYHGLVGALVISLNILIRFQWTNRPVALQQGQTKEVKSLAPAPPVDGGSAPRAALIFLAAALAMSLASVSGCAKAPPNLSPAGVAAFNNTRITKGLDLLRDTAIDANAQTPPLISEATAGKVVRYHKLAITALHDGVGSPSTLKQGLDNLVKDLPPRESALLSPYVTLLKAVIDEVIQ